MRRFPRLAAFLAAAALTVGIGGCGTSQKPAEEDAQALKAPVTVKHRFGTTKIDKVPKRIVTIDLQWTDTMLAMGVKPVGVTTDSLMPKSGVPWQQPPSGVTKLSLDDGVPVEKIMALNPDLIVGSFSIADKETYDLLAARAPTIAGPPNADEVTPWRELVTTAGKVLDQPSKAEQVITSVDERIAATAEEFPNLKGRTFALSQYIVGDAMYIVADEKDGSSRLFKELGMNLYPPVLKEGEKTGKTRINVSTERADLLRADLLAFLVNGGDEGDLADIPGFDALPGEVALLSYPTVVGLNTPTPLSIPYALAKLRPHLEKADKAGA